jgi:branched-chain amino acid transport system substrate-binding protein
LVVLAAVSVAVGGLCGCGTRRSTAELEAALRPQPIASAVAGAPGTASQAPSGGMPIQAPASAPAATNPTAPATAPGPLGSAGPSGQTTPGNPLTTTGHQSSSHPGSNRAARVSLTQPIPGIESNCSSQLDPITIGSVGEQSGIAGAAVASGAQTVAAWAGYVNSLGGLRCHPIKFLTADDGGDPSRNEAETQQLVEQDHVVAFVYNDGPLASDGSVQYLVQHHIPAIGTGGLEPAYKEHPNFFPQTAVGNDAVPAGMLGIIRQLTHSERQHVGLISCIEAAECSQAKTETPKYAHRLGFKIVYNGSASLTAPSYTSQCLAARKAGVQALSLVLDPSSIHRAAANCRDAGYTGKFATVSTVVTADDTSDANLNHLVFTSPVKPWVTTTNAQIALMDQVLAHYAPGVSSVGSAAMGWTSAQLFAASSVYWPAKPNITSSDILTAMGHIKHHDVGGLTAPLTFVTGHNAVTPLCDFEMAIENGKFVSPNNGGRLCL